MGKRKEAPIGEGEEETDTRPEGRRAEEEPTSSDSYSSSPEGPSSSSEESESEDDSDGEAFDNVTVDFDFGAPEEANFHGLKALLTGYLDGEAYNTSALVDLVIAQKGVGTVVKTGEEQDVLGLHTVLPTSQVTEAIPQIAKYFKDQGVSSEISDALVSPDCGLLLSEHVRNMPAEVAPHLLETLLDELKASKDARCLRRIVFVTRAFLINSEGSSSGPSGSKRSKKAGKAKQPEELLYTQPEAEVLAPRATAISKYALAGEQHEREAPRPLRVLMLLDLGEVHKALPTLEQLVG